MLAGTAGQPRTAVCDDPTDTWGHRVISYAWPGAAMKLERIVVRETGPLRTRVRVERSWGGSLLIEELLLGHDSRTLRVDVTIDWREKAHLLKLRYPVGPRRPAGDLRDPVRRDRASGRRRGGARAVVGRPHRNESTARPRDSRSSCTNKHGWDVSPAGSQGSTCRASA